MAVLVAILAVFIVFYWFRRMQNGARLLPPGPPGLPLLGSLPFLGNDLQVYFAEFVCASTTTIDGLSILLWG